MVGTDDFVICVVSSESMANCTDHSGPKGWVGGWVDGLCDDYRYES